MPTIAEMRRALAARLRAASLDTPDLDARILTGHALQLPHATLVSNATRVLTDDEASLIESLALRRLAGEPVARIVGMKEFWGLPLTVGAATLVPRPETETVVEAALAAIDEGGKRDRALRIADLGTGTGAILLALLSELPNAFGVATDTSFEALETARANARLNGLETRAHFIACDFGTALSCGFDLVVSNPPYIASADIADLPREVRHDPRKALDGGDDGLAAYRAIASDARRLLAPGGHIVLELGQGQSDAVARFLQSEALEMLPAKPDLAGIARASTARVASKPP